MKKRYVEIDHSGDVGIEAWGKTVEELVENVTLGLFSLLARGPVETGVKRELSVSSESREDLLVDWLSEVITAASTFGEVYGSVETRHSEPFELTGKIGGAPADSGRHELRFEVKAATYHGLVFECVEDGYHARIIFDL